MGVFDDLIKVDNDGKIFYNRWVEWVHFSIPNRGILREFYRNYLAIFRHCFVCTALDGCYFLRNNMPP